MNKIEIQFETVDRIAVQGLPAEPHRVCFAVVDGRRAEIAIPASGTGDDWILREHLVEFLRSEGYQP